MLLFQLFLFFFLFIYLFIFIIIFFFFFNTNFFSQPLNFPFNAPHNFDMAYKNLLTIWKK